MFNFGKLNRKQKRKFNKEFKDLDQEKKTEVIQTAFMEQVNHTMSKEIAKAMRDGIQLGKEQLYEKYVKDIDGKRKSSKEWYDAVDQLLSVLRVNHIEMEKRKILAEKSVNNGGKNS